MNYRTKFKLASSLMLFLTLTACGTSQSSSAENAASSAETTSVTETATVAQGAAVAQDSESPSGYTVTFNYKEDKENIKSVSVVGPFNYLDPNLDITDASNAYSPHQYVNGMYASSYVPSKGMASGFNYTEQLTYDEATESYQTSFPITSGSFAYSYVIEYEDGTTETIADPANPAPALANASSNAETSEINKSVVYGHYDEEKQSESPNLDFVLPSEDAKGTLEYVEYTGNLAADQDLGIYTPSDYDGDRAEPYKVVYVSHGGGGNETDWFALGHLDNIMDNLDEDVIVVTMDNTSYEWDFEKIEENVLDFIIPYMESNYNVSTEAADRAFAGLSMGSMTTMNMLFDHPEAFAYFGSFSGPDMTAVTDNEAVSEPTYFMTVGTTDIASEKVLPNDDPERAKKYEDFIAWEAENDLPNFVDGGYIKGGHDWFTWSQSFKTFIEEVCWQ